MLSIATITRMSQDSADLAKVIGKAPTRFNFADVKTFPPFPFPFLGGWTPDGFTPLKDEQGDDIALFCDSSGMGGAGELALTMEQLQNRLRDLILEHGQTTGNLHAHLYGAIVEDGEFQVVVGLYTWNGEELPDLEPMGCPNCESTDIIADTLGNTIEQCEYCPNYKEDGDCDQDCPEYTLCRCRECGAVFALENGELREVNHA